MRAWWYTRTASLERFIGKVSITLGRLSPNALMLTLATLVGIGAGFTSVAFAGMLELAHDLFFRALDWIKAVDPRLAWLLPVVPAVGGLLVGPLVQKFAREAKGHGVPEVMDSVASRGGLMRRRVVLVKAVASAITIGSGGSAGQEGPIVQIGAALGSSFGRLFNLSTPRLKVLVGCGAAGGISAIFNAPIGGVLFALEIILGDFSLRTFSPVVVSSVVASVIAQSFLGSEPAFSVPAYHIGSPFEMFSYVILGALCGIVAVAFVKMLYGTEDLFDAWKIPPSFKPMIGGLLTGCIALVAPGVLGGGYPAIGEALNGQATVMVLLLLFFLKPLATCMTLGSGGSGGVFAPSLFLGAMLGGLYGYGMEYLFPELAAASSAVPHPLVGAYAMVGMGAVVGASTHAWMTSAIIVFEMTDSYSIILPLMLTTLVSMLVSRVFSTESIYTLKLARKGTHIGRGINLAILEKLHVADAMFTNYVYLRPGAPVEEVVRTARKARSYDFPVVTKDGTLMGMISLPDVGLAIEAEVPELLVAADLATSNYTPLYADETLASALDKFDLYDRPTLPVLSRTQENRIVGMLDRRQILNMNMRMTTLGIPEGQDKAGQAAT